MPRKNLWRRGAGKKKGDSHPSNHGLMLDTDQLVNPPVKKDDIDQVKPPVKKVIVTVIGSPKSGSHRGCNSDCHSDLQIDCLSKRISRTDKQYKENKKLSKTNVRENQLLREKESQNCHLQLHNESQNSHLQAHDESQNSHLESPSGSDVHSIKMPSNICNVKTIFASHNQGDERYSSFSRGSQCTCMSLSLVLTMLEDDDFSSSYLDRVLYRGDNLYKKVLMDLMNEGKFKSKLLLFDELPTAVEYNGKLYNITKHTSVIGLPIVESHTSENFSLHEAVVFAFSKSDDLLIMIGAICSALVRRDNRYILFDSHSHGTDGLSTVDGKAIMKCFSSIDDIVAFLYAFYISANIHFTSQFEILPFSVQQIMHRFLDDESEGKPTNSAWVPNQQQNGKMMTKNTSSGNVKTNRVHYMKEYMRTKRQEREFHDKELASKQLSRNNVDYRRLEQHKELASKRRARENNDIREKEMISKREARKNVDYRQQEQQKELASKRRARERKDIREKEMISKREARKNVGYRQQEQQKDLASKRRARESKDIREKEKISKREARKNVDYRQEEQQKDLASKRRARERKDIREKEMISKREARKNVAYRQEEQQKELASKRRARQSVGYRHVEQQRELSSKRIARENKDIREKEMISKREARKNVDYRQEEQQRELASKRKARQNVTKRNNEMQSKRVKRCDEHFQQEESKHDLKRKRNLRQNPEVLEKERLAKEKSRKKDGHKEKERQIDKSRKSGKRNNPEEHAIESSLAKKRKYGSTMKDCIEKFHSAIGTGPVYICCCCQQTWFFQSVCRIKEQSSLIENYSDLLTDVVSQNKRWLCVTCRTCLQKCQVPKLSVANGMKWPSKPNELNLHPLEERLISLRIPFMQIRELPRGRQYCVKGNVVNVPVDIQPTINSLPRQMDENFTVPVKLKKKVTYKKCDFTENVRPAAVLSALHWLMNSSTLYRESGVNIDDAWLQRINEDSSEIVREFTESHSVTNDNQLCQELENQIETNEYSMTSGNIDNTECTHTNEDQSGNESDSFSEVDADDNVVGNADTLLDDDPVCHDKSYTFAPGEGQNPLSLYTDKDAEFLSFPTLFCGERRPENKDRKVPVHYSDIVKWELRSMDRRAAQSVPNIFFKLKRIQLKQISDKVHLAIRRCKTKGKKITAAEARDQSALDRIVRLDEGFYIFRQLRNSPAYLSAKKKDIFAMIRQLGLPTWFMSLSSADTRWPDLLKVLAKLNEGKDLSYEEIQKLTWMEKTKLIQKDPVTSSRFFDHRVQQFINIVLKSPHNPIGKVTDFFYRVEFQQRGSPHIHMLVWIEQSPKYQTNTEEEIENFVDSFITCSNESEGMENLVGMQTHKHSKTCRKQGKALCRFGFPLPPLSKTMLLEPLEDEVEKHKKMYDEVQKKINSFKDGLQMTFDRFLNEIASMTEDEYIKCIRSSLHGPKVFLKRRPADVRVNLYNEALLNAWNANMDLQFVLDPYACAMYIVSYISKSQRGMSALLDRACKEARQGNMDIKKQVRHIGNKFLNSVEVSAQEACYLTLQMPLTKGTRDVLFINTSPPSERVFLLKQQSKLEELGADSTNISCDNIIQRYSKRPRALQNWCLADYCSELDVKFPENTKSDEKEEREINDDATENQSDSEDYFSDENTILTLKNGIVIKRRFTERIIRYVHYNKKTDPENHYREKLLLFLPWRNEEVDILGGYSCYKDHYESCRCIVENKAKKYEHHIEELEQARQAAEEELDIHDELAPNAQQANADDELEGQEETDDYVHFNPDRPIEHTRYDIGPDVGAATASSMISNSVGGRIADEQYNQLLRSLNARQREFFQHVLHWIKTKDDPLYSFLSGGAGVGKSVLIRAIYQALHRHLHSGEGEDPDDIRILKCAFTGKAAYNIDGVTIASAFHKKYNQLNQSMNSDELNTYRMKYRNLSVIIIDEISMVGNKMLNFMDTRLKELTGTNRPFGGKSIIAVGDLYQLQPVGDSWIFNDLSHGAQILATNLWKEHFEIYELTEIMRQRDDLHFADMLNRLRVNELTDEDKKEIQKHIISPADPQCPRNVPHLFIENKFVDSFNDQFITNLVGPKTTIQSHDTVVADLPKTTKERLLNCIPKDASKTANLAHSLTIAEGMIYDIAVNLDVNDGLANGSTCIAKCIEYRMHQSKRPSIVWVLFDDENIGSATKQKYSHLYSCNIDPKWTPIFEVNRNFMYNYKSYQRIQFPLKPSAAKTVHKAQGSTVDNIVIDLSQTRTRKIPHIHYVALSRVRKLQNLHILNFNEEALTVDDRVKEEMNRLRRESQMQLCYIPLYNIDSKNLRVALNNARSFHKHFVDFATDLNILSADIVGIMESRLIPTDEDMNYRLEGYQMHRCDQVLHQINRRPPHGLVLYTKNHFTTERVVTHSTCLVEFLLVQLHSEKYNCLQVVLMYKAPACTLNEYKTQVTENLKHELDLHRPFMIMGDFNFDINGNDCFLEFMMQTFSCVQHVKGCTTNYGSSLDLIFSNFANVLTETVECYWSDHKIVYAWSPFMQ